ncbi:hypothetical protein AAF712_013754 [Marasmius tenuissimus]|uniref:Uncharacterized protein n=1 Tax=Marasmius tenuissimus TaxID=585030 RepID=A0ABR2ZEW1_9AGAR
MPPKSVEECVAARDRIQKEVRSLEGKQVALRDKQKTLRRRQQDLPKGTKSAPQYNRLEQEWQSFESEVNGLEPLVQSGRARLRHANVELNKAKRAVEAHDKTSASSSTLTGGCGSGASSDPYSLFGESELTPVEEIEEGTEVSETEGPPPRDGEAEKRSALDGKFEEASQPMEGAPKGGSKKRPATAAKTGRKKVCMEGDVQEAGVKARPKRTKTHVAPVSISFALCTIAKLSDIKAAPRRTRATTRLQMEETNSTDVETTVFDQRLIKAAGGEVKHDDDNLTVLPPGVSMKKFLAGPATATSQPSAGPTEGTTSFNAAEDQGAEQEGETKADGGPLDSADKNLPAVDSSGDTEIPKPAMEESAMECDDIAMDIDTGKNTVDVGANENRQPVNKRELTAQSQIPENHGASQSATVVPAIRLPATSRMPGSSNDEDVALSRLDAEDSDDESEDEEKQTGGRKGKSKVGEAKPLKNGGDRRYFRKEIMENEAIEAIEQFVSGQGRSRGLSHTLRGYIRGHASRCPEAATTCREIAIQVLVSQQAFIKCNYHHKSGKHRGRYIFDGMNPDDPSPRVTGVPFPPSEPKKTEEDQSFRKEKDNWAPLVRCEIPKRNGIEVCHCGCTLEDALWGLYLWKTGEIASASNSGRWDNYRTDWIDPRQRKFIIERLREHGVRLDHLWKYRLEDKGPVRVYVEVSKADRLRAQIKVLTEMLAELEGEEDSETDETGRSESAE